MMISNDFTIEEIHKIRYANYEETKNLSSAQLIEKTKNHADIFKMKLKKYKKSEPIGKNSI